MIQGNAQVYGGSFRDLGLNLRNPHAWEQRVTRAD